MRQSWHQDTPIGPITVMSGPRGVEKIWFSTTADADDANLDVLATTADSEPRRDPAVAKALDAWFAGEVTTLDVEVDVTTVTAPFARHVLETLRREVGWGEVVSYGELAEMAGSPGAARAVGTTMAHNPVPFVIPCHRVIAARGKLGGYGGTTQGVSRNLAIKRWLLAHEGVLLLDA